MSTRLGFAVLAVWLVTPTATAGASEWFVAPGGNGSGTVAAPFGTIQAGLDAARPGDIVTVAPGIYTRSFVTVRNGNAAEPITVRAAGPRGSVLVTAPGRVLTVNHAHIIVTGLVLDGQYGPDDLVRVSVGGNYLQLRDMELRRSNRDLVDMGAPQGVLIDGCLIHHALNAAGGRTDAHGIAAGAVRDLTIRNTEIHTFSGDGVQVDSGRSAPGWTGVTIEGAKIWLAPLPAPENGFPAGAITGENAVDTKASASFGRATIHIRDTVASGFRDSALMSNAAAFNLKENVDAFLDGVTVYDSQIAFRTRGPNAGSPAGAWVTIKNAVVYDVVTAFRYEDNIEHLRIWNSTLGRGVGSAFLAGSSNSHGLEIRNMLVLGDLPDLARTSPSNLGASASDFVDAALDDYRLVPRSRAIDAGFSLPDVLTDRIGTSRPQARGYDIGAFERSEPKEPTTAEPRDLPAQRRNR